MSTFSDQRVLRAGAGALKSDFVAADNVIVHHAGNNALAVGVITATSSGAGGVISCAALAHGRTTSEVLAVQIRREKGRGQGLGVVYTITRIDDDNFTLDGTVFSGALSTTGTWELIENATDKWYPGVGAWIFVLARGADVTFDAGCLLSDQDLGQVRPGDAPQDGEVIPAGQFWGEGPLSVFVMKTGGGAARLVRV